MCFAVQACCSWTSSSAQEIRGCLYSTQFLHRSRGCPRRGVNDNSKASAMLGGSSCVLAAVPLVLLPGAHTRTAWRCNAWAAATLGSDAWAAATLGSDAWAAATLGSDAWAAATLCSDTWAAATLGSDAWAAATLGSDAWAAATLGSDAWAAATLGSDAWAAATLGSDTWAAATLGSDAWAAATLGSDAWAAATLGSDAWAAATLGSDAWAAATLGSDAWAAATLPRPASHCSRTPVPQACAPDPWLAELLCPACLLAAVCMSCLGMRGWVAAPVSLAAPFFERVCVRLCCSCCVLLACWLLLRALLCRACLLAAVRIRWQTGIADALPSAAASRCGVTVRRCLQLRRHGEVLPAAAGMLLQLLQPLHLIKVN
ncbi:hypothetical protein COO60DRAFT_1659992 [Scenedesmus sp. NREL 46B-D3]|nr:hypothetical protein COO60DRAFT_1659992 [Scenedesmus sp. NREL 46B-D3]